MTSSFSSLFYQNHILYTYLTTNSLNRTLNLWPTVTSMPYWETALSTIIILVIKSTEFLSTVWTFESRQRLSYYSNFGFKVSSWNVGRLEHPRSLLTHPNYSFLTLILNAFVSLFNDWTIKPLILNDALNEIHSRRPTVSNYTTVVSTGCRASTTAQITLLLPFFDFRRCGADAMSPGTSLSRTCYAANALPGRSHDWCSGQAQVAPTALAGSTLPIPSGCLMKILNMAKWKKQ